MYKNQPKYNEMTVSADLSMIILNNNYTKCSNQKTYCVASA